MHACIRFLVEVGQFWLRSTVLVQNERLASKILVEGVHPIQGVGNVQQKRRIVCLMI